MGERIDYISSLRYLKEYTNTYATGVEKEYLEYIINYMEKNVEMRTKLLVALFTLARDKVLMTITNEEPCEWEDIQGYGYSAMINFLDMPEYEWVTNTKEYNIGKRKYESRQAFERRLARCRLRTEDEKLKEEYMNNITMSNTDDKVSYKDVKNDSNEVNKDVKETEIELLSQHEEPKNG